MSESRASRNLISVLSAVALVAFQLVASTDPADAAAFTVTKTEDTADGTCDTDCSLREAIIAANVAAGLDTITVPAGTYLLDLVGANEDAALTGDLDITDDLTITGAGAAQTIVDGNQTDRVFDLVGPGLTVNISALTVQNGRLTGSENVQDDGAGIRLRDSGAGLTLTNAVVRDNSTDTGAAGGGVFLVGGNTLTLDGTRIGEYGHGNFANRGGGIKGNGTDNVINVTKGSSVSYNEVLSSGAGIFLLGQSHDVTIDASEVSHNVANSGDGGGIYLHAGSSGSNFIVRNGSKISENSAQRRGGGIRALNDFDFSLQITGSEVLANQASLGGGLYVSAEDSFVDLDGARVAFNRAFKDEGCADVGDGGGIWSRTLAPPPEGNDPPGFGLNIRGSSSIDHNWGACDGGGIFSTEPGTAVVRDSSVDHNLAGGMGGGIYNDVFSNLEIIDSAIDLNSTAQGDGGGIFNLGLTNLLGASEVAGNSAADGSGGGIFNAGERDDGPPQGLFIGPSQQSDDGPVIVGNTADGSGAGIYNTVDSALVTQGAAVVGNTAVDDHNTESSGGGGGIFNAGHYEAFQTLIAYNVAATRHGGGLWNAMDGETSGGGMVVVGNVAKGDGGGIFNDSVADGEGFGVSLSCSAIASNAATNGGGIANRGSFRMAGCFGPRGARMRVRKQMNREVALANRTMQAEVDEEPVFPPIDPDLFGQSLVVENTSAEDGGGVWNGSTMDITGTTIGGNTAPLGFGGGVHNAGVVVEGWALRIEDSTLLDNFAQKGGGLFNAFEATVLMINDTISGNFTNGTGGGIDDESGLTATTKLVHVTVFNNSAPEGNGGGLDASIDTPGDIRVASSIVALNLGGDCSSPVGITSEDYNFSSDNSCAFFEANDQTDGGDPRLGPLTNNGGATDTHLPEEGSPVIDAAEPGDPAPCIAGGEVVERDQRGEIRPESFTEEEERCDIGSVELQFSDVPPPDDGGGDFTTFAAQPGPTYTPNTTDDHVPDGCDEFEAEVADCTLREAVIAANADGVDSTINVPAGRYVLTLAGAAENLSATGDLDVADDVTIVGEVVDGFNSSIVDGDQSDRVFDINPDGLTPLPVVHLNDLVIQNGRQTNAGGIQNFGDLRLDNTQVVFNRATCIAGGIYTETALTIADSSVVKNGLRGSECSNAGGGIFVAGGPAGSASISGSEVDLNNAPLGGAGIFNVGLGATPALDVDDSSVSLNVLTSPPDENCPGCVGGGGGIYNETTATLTNTDVIGNVTSGGSGGGIYNGGFDEGASLLMPEGDRVISNVAFGFGGGLFADRGSTADIEGATFAGNTASGGGAIYNVGTLLESAGSTYLMNTAIGQGGGGLWNAGGRSTLEGDGVLFNRATTSVGSGDDTLGGGGIQNDSNGTRIIEEGEDNSGVVFNDGTIVGNATPSAVGGGVNNRGTMYVDGSLVTGNSASAPGRGGGGATNCHILYVDDSTVDGNIAPDGDAGGLLNREICNRNLTLHITNSTVSANAAAGDGGGVQNDLGTTEVLNSTFSGNFAAAGTGGGLDEVSPDTTHLHNVTIAFNSAPFSASNGGGVSHDGGGEVTALNTLVGLNFGGDCDELLTSEGHNLDSDSSCFDGPTDILHPGTLLDPKLGPLALNGNPALTETHALLDGSPAIDKTPDDEECPETDQRHVTRPQGPSCDIGAYEREFVAPPPSPSVSPTPTTGNTGGGGGGGGGGESPPDLAVTKTASPEPVASGGKITYEIVVKNNGPVTASGVTTTDTLPNGVTLDSASASQGSCSGNTTVVCELGIMNNGATATVTIVVTVTAQSGTLTNSVSVHGSQPDPKPDNNRAEATSTIPSSSPSPGPTTAPTPKCPGFEDDPRNQIVGTDADDELVGTPGPDIICGLGGNDVLRGLGDDDILIGDSGPVATLRLQAPVESTNNDLLRGGFGNDVLFANEGHDRLRGGRGNDVLNGQLGRDGMGGYKGRDKLRGQQGRDRGRGGPGRDVVRGGRGHDHMEGNADNDVVRGGRGRDQLFGKRGNDKVIGGKGKDTENGGLGTDVCLELTDERFHCES